jgi:hypothetical protein
VTITADSKKRVVIPGAKPGDVFAVVQQDENHITLARLQSPPPLPSGRMTKIQVARAIKHSKLEFDMTWDELRAVTREP